MADGEHQGAAVKSEFCAMRADTPCGSCEWKGQGNYRKICEPSWASFSFKQRLTKDGVSSTFDKSYEAHHVLCVASVNRAIAEFEDIEPTVQITKWCINGEPNMLAMPLFGHTVKYYCNLAAFDTTGQASGFRALGQAAFQQYAPAPPFSNIPQHDWDHNCTSGWTDEMADVIEAKLTSMKKAGHAITPTSLRGALTGLSNSQRTVLTGRGSRKGGTHSSWARGQDAPESDWYLDFSMALQSVAEARPAPRRSFDQRTAGKLLNLVRNILT